MNPQNNDDDVVPPIIREFFVTPEFVVELSKAGRFEVSGKTLPPDAQARLDLTRWDAKSKRLVIAVQSNQFPDVMEELVSPHFKRV